MRAIVLDKFATVGIPDFENECAQRNCWSVVALSRQLIDEGSLDGFQLLNTRQLDLVVNSGTKFALLNLQAFKLFESSVATDLVKHSVQHHLTSNGSLLFGLQPSGDVFVLTNSLKNVKTIHRPGSLLKLQQHHGSGGLGEWLLQRLWNIFGLFTRYRSNRVSPKEKATSPDDDRWTTTGEHEHHSIFPYLTAVPDGFALLCVFSAQDCFLFLSSYETALLNRSIGKIRGSEVPGHWLPVLMDRHFIENWLEGKRQPSFDSRLCYAHDANNNLEVRGAMMYAALVGLQLKVVYGVINRMQEKFVLSWETLEYQFHRVVEDDCPVNLGGKYVCRLSSDCSKLAVVISTHFGAYSQVSPLKSYPKTPVKMERQRVCLCTHGDYNGTFFYRRGCWVSDLQWLVEDVYYACITLCGSLTIFHASSGEPMIIKVRQPGAEPMEDRTARFFLPVFHQHQISSDTSDDREDDPGNRRYPTLKWVDSEKVLVCSSGMKTELLSIKRVLNLSSEEIAALWNPSVEDEQSSVSESSLRSEASSLSPVRVQDSMALLLAPTPQKNQSLYDIDKNSDVDPCMGVIEHHHHPEI